MDGLKKLVYLGSHVMLLADTLLEVVEGVLCFIEKRRVSTLGGSDKKLQLGHVLDSCW